MNCSLNLTLIPTVALAERPKLMEIRTLSSSLLTPRAAYAARHAPIFKAPQGPVPQTNLIAHVCRSPYMLRHGMWPLNPLCDSRLVAFCHRLPFSYRTGRTLLRHYLHRSIGCDLFPTNYEKETFERVLPKVISLHIHDILKSLTECALADLGLVHMDRVRALLKHVARTQEVTFTAPPRVYVVSREICPTA